MPDVNDIAHYADVEAIRARFLAKVNVTDGCWEWTAHKMKLLPYGRMTTRRGECQLAHRLSYVLHVGKIPEGAFVLHRCDNPSCVRPDHLFLGTNIDNMNDKVAKGRQSSLPGDKHPMAKLRSEDVVEIFNSRQSGVSLANQYGVSPNAICKIRKRRAWQTVTGYL